MTAPSDKSFRSCGFYRLEPVGIGVERDFVVIGSVNILMFLSREWKRCMGSVLSVSMPMDRRWYREG